LLRGPWWFYSVQFERSDWIYWNDATWASLRIVHCAQHSL